MADEKDSIDMLEVRLVAKQIGVPHLSGVGVLEVVNEILRRRAFCAEAKEVSQWLNHQKP